MAARGARGVVSWLDGPGLPQAVWARVRSPARSVRLQQLEAGWLLADQDLGGLDHGYDVHAFTQVHRLCGGPRDRGHQGVAATDVDGDLGHDRTEGHRGDPAA